MTNEPALILTDEERAALRAAVLRLECAGFLIKAASALGAPIERLLNSIPEKARDLVQEATKRAIERCLDIAIKSLGSRAGTGSLDALHKAACTASGALGGFFGMYALPIELPFSTAIMLRSIADIAREEGEDLDDMEAKLACVSVFALGAHHRKDDDAEIGYFAVRAALAKALPNLAERTLPRALSRFVAIIAERFGLVVSEKVVAEAVPIVGAVGGSTINLVFIDHFQEVAHGHFTVRRLERKYGQAFVRRQYEELRRDLNC
jgi:hypothetical protein